MRSMRARALIGILRAGFGSGLILVAGLVGAQSISDTALASAAASDCADHRWKKRGRAPAGFIKGISVSYAKAWCEARKQPESVAAALAGVEFKPERDALAHYGVSGGSAESRLRSLYALAIGQGMRESSGNTTEGYDRTVRNQTEQIAEAGLFQVSYDSINASPWLKRLWDQYAADPGSCALSVFQEGIKKVDRSEVGTGKGAEFQRFTRACPVFAVEYAAVMMRTNLNHFGPIKRKEAELLPACVAMLQKVEADAAANCP